MVLKTSSIVLQVPAYPNTLVERVCDTLEFLIWQPSVMNYDAKVCEALCDFSILATSMY